MLQNILPIYTPFLIFGGKFFLPNNFAKFQSVHVSAHVEKRFAPHFFTLVRFHATTLYFVHKNSKMAGSTQTQHKKDKTRRYANRSETTDNDAVSYRERDAVKERKVTTK